MWMSWICMYMMQVGFYVLNMIYVDESTVGSYQKGCRIKCYPILLVLCFFLTNTLQNYTKSNKDENTMKEHEWNE